jgi:hypothetical protein
MENSDIICALCTKSLEGDTVVVTKGLRTIIEVSVTRQDGLHEKLQGKTSVRVHKKCRQNYTRPSSVKAATTTFLEGPDVSLSSSSSPYLRKFEEKFDYKTMCFICGKTTTIDSKTALDRRKEIRVVATLEIKDNVLKKNVTSEMTNGEKE